MKNSRPLKSSDGDLLGEPSFTEKREINARSQFPRTGQLVKNVLGEEEELEPAKLIFAQQGRMFWQRQSAVTTKQWRTRVLERDLGGLLKPNRVY